MRVMGLQSCNLSRCHLLHRFLLDPNAVWNRYLIKLSSFRCESCELCVAERGTIYFRCFYIACCSKLLIVVRLALHPRIRKRAAPCVLGLRGNLQIRLCDEVTQHLGLGCCVQVNVQRRETERQAEMRLKSYSYHAQQESEELWQELEVCSRKL